MDTHAVFIEGVTGRSIVELAEKLQPELIVMGTHGHNMLMGLLLGGVSRVVVKKSSSPVLLVPSRGVENR